MFSVSVFSVEDCLTCPDNPDHKCGHSTVDSFVSVQKSTRLFSTNGAVSMEMNKIDRAPKVELVSKEFNYFRVIAGLFQ